MEDDSLKQVRSLASGSIVSTDPSSFDFDSLMVNSEKPEFEIEKVQLQFDLQNSLQHLRVANNVMYIISAKSIFRIDLESPSDVAQILVPASPDSKITNCWLHPNGHHLIIQANGLQYFYLNDAYTKFKSLPRFKGISVKHIAFTALQDNKSTGDFLLTTNDENVYVAMLKTHDPATHEGKRDDKYMKQVYKAVGSIDGISFANNATQIQLFAGGQILVWDCFEPTLAELTRVFRLAPITSPLGIEKSKSVFLSARDKYYLVAPKSKDIYSNDEEVQMSRTEKLNTGPYEISDAPNSFIATAHHLIFISSSHDSLVILNKLLPQTPIVLNLRLSIEANEKVIGLVADPIGDTNWIFMSNGIYELVITNESVSVWYNYYKMGKYEEALKFLEASDPNSKTWFKQNVVLIKKGYDLLQKGGFGIECLEDEISDEFFKMQVNGIRLLAKLQEPFEKVCLMLLNVQLPGPEFCLISNRLLVEYLKVKFVHAKNVEKSKIKIIVLSSWIVQLYLRMIHVVQKELSLEKESEASAQNWNGLEKHKPRIRANLDALNEALESFLSNNYKIIDSKTIYQILKEMDFPSMLLFYSNLLEDYEFLLDYNIEQENWVEALKVLIKLYTRGTDESKSIIYRTSIVLLINFPKQTVETWFKFSDLDYEKLLPAILTYNKKNDTVPCTQNLTIHFMLRLIFEKNVKSSVLNNYYLSLLVTYPSRGDEAQTTKAIIKMLEHMKGEGGTGFRRESLYDADFLLRLCLRFQRYQPAILIQIDLQLFDSALKLALDKKLTFLAEFVLKKFDEHILQDTENTNYEFVFDDSGAEDVRHMSKIKLEDDHFGSRKKLWMLYAKYLIKGVCNGVHFDVLDIIKDDYKEEQPGGKPESNSVKKITSNLIGLIVPAKNDVFESTSLNKVLRYLLRLSYSSNRNANVLTLKDLLPLFPQSIMISNFKDEIVESLNQYNNRINQLTLEMQESSEIAEKLKAQIKETETEERKGSVYTIIEPGEACPICKMLLIDRNFIVFPNCHHSFHKDCCVRSYLKLKGDYRFKKIFQSFKQNSSVTDKRELDELLLKECLLCNESNINTVDDSLIDEERDKNDIEEWQI